jgi:hypothetical protein
MVCDAAEAKSAGSGAKARFAQSRETLRTTGLVSRGSFVAKESLRRSLHRHWHPALIKILRRLSMRFLRQGGIYLVRWGFRNQNQTLDLDRSASRRIGPSPGKGTRREDRAPSHRPQMSSGRLFLDRVARQHCPSPLHRHGQNNMRFPEGQGEGDISTLPAWGHFYFALTQVLAFCSGKVIMSPLAK